MNEGTHEGTPVTPVGAELPALGIDVSKGKLDVALLLDGKVLNKRCANDKAGLAELGRWLAARKVERAHVCLEATGRYADLAAETLHDAGHVVSLINPARAKAFADARMARTKTDKADAGVLAAFCQAMRPAPWAPPSPAQREMLALRRRLDELREMAQMERNRLEGGVGSEAVEASIRRLVAELDEAIRRLEREIDDHVDRYPDLKRNRALLESIKGVGPETSSLLLGELGDMSQFASARQAAAHCGLVPARRQSGRSLDQARLSKKGNGRVRSGLYMAAVVAARHNPLLKAFFERLVARGLKKKAAICAVMRKLVHVAFGVLRHQKPFDPAYAAQAC